MGWKLEWKNNRYIVILNILCFVVCWNLMSFVYESNDDTGIRELINGARGVRDPHLVYQNILLGELYKVCYDIMPNVPWYDIIQYIVLLGSFTIVSYVLINKLGWIWGGIVVVILESFFAVECYVHPQYTKTAGIAVATGLYLIFWSISKVKTEKKEITIGILFVCIGFMYREQEAIAVSGIMSAMGIYVFLKSGGDGVKKLREGLNIVIGILICVMFLKAINYVSYVTNPEWKYYCKYNELRTELLDYGFPEYDSNKAVYEKLGINRDAFELYSTWNYNDPDKFNIIVMKKLVSIKQKSKISLNEIIDYFEMIPRMLETSHSFRCVALLEIIWIILKIKKEKREWICIVYMLCIWLMIYFYMFHRGRYGINRVDVGLWYGIAIIIAYLLDIKFRNYKLKNVIILNITMLGLVYTTINEVYEYCYPLLQENLEEGTEVINAEREVAEIIGQNKENLYIVKTGCFSSYNIYGIFDKIPNAIFNNICNLGGWECNIPNQIRNMEKYNIKNPFKDSVNNKNTIWIDDDINLTIRYIRTYYNEDAKAECICKIGDMKLYKIVAEKSFNNVVGDKWDE